MVADSSYSFLRKAFHPEWVDLAPAVLGEDASPLDHKTAKLWSLVLSSRHLPHRMRQLSVADGGGHTVQVQEWFAERAVEEIQLYLSENTPSGPLVLPDLRPVSGVEPVLGAMIALVIFYWFYSRTYPSFGLYPELWVKLGSSEAARIMTGEWWRSITALTLHADGAHILGNALIGGVFVWLTARRLGAGLTWLLTILGGSVGNLVNAMVLAAPHNSIGFSTASFAAAGLLAGIAPFGVGGGVHGLGQGSLVHRGYRFVRSALIPVAAGLGLLAMLGAGEKTDLGAHLFGFLVGLGFGLGFGGLTTRFGLPSKRTDLYLYYTTILIVVCAWWIAWQVR